MNLRTTQPTDFCVRCALWFSGLLSRWLLLNVLRNAPIMQGTVNVYSAAVSCAARYQRKGGEMMQKRTRRRRKEKKDYPNPCFLPQFIVPDVSPGSLTVVFPTYTAISAMCQRLPCQRLQRTSIHKLNTKYSFSSIPHIYQL